MTVLTSIIQSIRNAASCNKHELAASRVILWPDEERLWTQCIEPLRASYPALWSLGDYAPDKATGPAAWLRYQLETQSGEDLPVIYLPGIGRSAFRSADQCPNQAKHLFALQFQGQFWTQKNGKNWTPFAFFSSADGSLGLDVGGDQDTKKAIQESLPKLLEAELDALQKKDAMAWDVWIYPEASRSMEVDRGLSNSCRTGPVSSPGFFDIECCCERVGRRSANG